MKKQNNRYDQENAVNYPEGVWYFFNDLHQFGKTESFWGYIEETQWEEFRTFDPSESKFKELLKVNSVLQKSKLISSSRVFPDFTNCQYSSDFVWDSGAGRMWATFPTDICQLAADENVVSDYLKTKQYRHTVIKYQSQLKWYKDQGLKSADELMRYARQSYEAGTIDYVEYMNSINQAFIIELDYLNILDQYNQKVVELQYTKGNYN